MSEHFFSRWSRRKQDALKGAPPDEPALPQGRSIDGPLPPEQDGPGQDQPQACDRESLPTLADAQALTPASDFGAFLQQGVPAEVRNAAVKKLFADPHFNVMDGLDIYIGDYNIPDPMPSGLLQKMASAQFMNLGPPETPAPATAPDFLPEKDPSVHPLDTPAPPVVAQSAPSQATTALPDLPVSEHDDPDLQLQPNHAPASPDPGPGAG